MSEKKFALKGILVQTPEFDKIEFHENEYVVVVDGVSQGIFKTLPEEYKDIKVYDYSDQLIFPGMSDIHLHAPQYGFRGMGECVDNSLGWNSWFEHYCFPEEVKYKDMEYAKKAYNRFVNDIVKTTSTTRVAAFATIHREATEYLMQKMDEAGMAGYIGKLNMDRNSFHGYVETTEESIRETERWILETKDAFKNIKPIVTPRYTPSCTDEVMEAIGKLCVKYNVPTMSHLSEGIEEIEWVKQLKPEIEFYGQAYDMYGLLGSTVPCIQAHCIHCTDDEFEMLRNRNVTVAHCPASNMSGPNGVARVMDMVHAGIKVGLGTDMAGGPNLSIMRAMTDAMWASKMRWMFTKRDKDPHAKEDYLNMGKAFYLATMGGGQFFGKVGCFEKGYEFDAVVIDDSDLRDFNDRPAEDRFQRVIWQHHARTIEVKFVKGELIYDRDRDTLTY